MQDRALVLLHIADVAGADRAHWQPRLACREATVACCVPPHRYALRIAVEIVSWNKLFEWILHRLFWNLGLLAAEFVSGKQKAGAFQSKKEHGETPRLCLSNLAGNTVLVVAADDPVGPRPLGDRIQVRIDGRLKRMRIPGAVQKRKVERQMHSRMVAAVEMTDTVRLALNFAAQ